MIGLWRRGDRTHPRPVQSILAVEALLAEGEK
jgi:hypothetical protein